LRRLSDVSNRREADSAGRGLDASVERISAFPRPPLQDRNGH
jgi:hypothetical protein